MMGGSETKLPDRKTKRRYSTCVKWGKVHYLATMVGDRRVRGDWGVGEGGYRPWTSRSVDPYQVHSGHEPG